MKVYVRVTLATLVPDRSAFPEELAQFPDNDLANLMWLPDDYFPGIKSQGYGYWPEVNGSAPLGQFQKYGGDISLTANNDTETVTAVKHIIPWTTQEIYDFQFAKYIELATNLEWRIPALENAAAKSLGYYSEQPMNLALSFLGMSNSSAADADLLNDWRGDLRDYIMSELADVKLLTEQNLALPSIESILAGAPAFPVRPVQVP